VKKSVIILFILLIGCISEKKKSLAEQFKFLKTEYNLEVKLDFSKKGIELIKDFENQIHKDFCNSSPYVNGVVLKNKEELRFPMIIYKYCDALFHPKNRIPILVNINNQVLIDSEFILQPNDSIEDNLISLTKDLLKTRNKSDVVYLLEWEAKIDSTLIKNRLIQILYVAKKIMNELSIEKYQKQVDKLSNEELKELKYIYNPFIGVEQGFIIESKEKILP